MAAEWLASRLCKMSQRCVALLGRRDVPTDAVEEYCTYLAEALGERGIRLEVERVAWDASGWSAALRDLRLRLAKEKNTWVLVQYTALGWSRRGFSFRVLGILRMIRECGARCGVVFHDAEPYFGNRAIDRIRRRIQLATMRGALRLADVAIVTVPPEKIPWVAGAARRPVFIPVGANLPAPESAWKVREARAGGVPAIAVFSLSPARLGEEEARTISRAALHVSEQMGALRVVVMGRNSEVARAPLAEALRGKPVEVVVHGILPGEQVVQELGACDAMLFVRGPISSRRGSCIAGIACGLPVIAGEGWETAEPITQAGVVLVPRGAADGFGPALLRVLTDNEYRDSLAERSRRAQAEHFSWQSIAGKFMEALAKGPE